MELQELGKRAKAAEVIMRNMGMKEKEKILLEVAEYPISARKLRAPPEKRHPGYSHTTKSTR